VAVKFVVTKAGLVEDAQIVKSQNDRLNKPALNVIRSIPVFRPAIKDGEIVSSYLTGIVHFR
jgi:TonB family protein